MICLIYYLLIYAIKIVAKLSLYCLIRYLRILQSCHLVKNYFYFNNIKALLQKETNIFIIRLATKCQSSVYYFFVLMRYARPRPCGFIIFLGVPSFLQCY